MNIYNHKVKDAIKNEINEFAKNHSEICVEVLADVDLLYRAFVHIGNWVLGEIVMHERDFTPYDNVSIQFFDLREKENCPFFLWFDDENSSEQDVLFAIKEGLTKALSVPKGRFC